VNLKPSGEAFPALIALAVAVAVTFVWRAFYDDVVHVVPFALAAGGAAYAGVRERARGPEVWREEWALNATEFGAGRVDDVLRGLEQHGYDISVDGIHASPTQPLAGVCLRLRDRRHPAPAAGLTLLLPGVAAPGQQPGFGLLTVVYLDANDGTYAEMAQYLIAVLGELVPGLRFKRVSSDMPLGPAAALRAKLPRSPRHLPGLGRSS
jgi:hypothetical protein